MRKLVFILMLSGAAFAQSFEVASVKVAAPLERPPSMGRSPIVTAIDDARVSITNATLAELVYMAYRVRAYQVSAPAWPTTRFNVQATIPAGAGKDKAPEMLQTLLRDRFHMVAHFEDREQNVYALIVAKGGSKLLPAPSEDADAKGATNQKSSTSADGNSVIMEQDNSIQGLCELATRFLTRPVVDMTELPGRYKMKIELSVGDMRTIAARNGNPSGDGAMKAPEAAADPTGGTILQSVQAMGLKLDPRKVVAPMLIIDKLGKLSEEN